MAELLCDLADRARDWRFLVDEDDGEEVQIVRMSPPPNRIMIGPLATIMLQDSFEDAESGEPMFDLSGEDGLMLYALAALPQLAGLVVWATEEIDKLNGIDFDGTNNAGRFHNELRRRLNWLTDLIDKRDSAVGEGTHGLAVYEPD